MSATASARRALPRGGLTIAVLLLVAAPFAAQVGSSRPEQARSASPAPATSGLSSAALSGLPASAIADIETALSAEMSRLGIPGLSVAIVTEDQLRWTNGYGLSDLENFVPTKASTVYRLGSVSKPITATAVLQLAERGRLDLDAPIQRYVPEFPVKPWPITSRQLLSHQGGIRHYREGEFDSTRHYDSIATALSIFKHDPLGHEPGTKYLYSTYGYCLLGAVVEGASGTKFVDYLRENVFRPAGMERARDDDLFAIISHRAQGYYRSATGELRNSPLADTSNKIPGGGLCATAPDVARFARALQTGLLLRPETLEQMFSEQRTKDGRPIAYGLGWRLSQSQGRREVWHTGGQYRVSNLLYMRPEQRLAVALLTNLEGIGPALIDLARKIADTATR